MKKWQNNIKTLSIDSKKVTVIKICCIVCGKYRNFKNLKYVFLKETLSFSISKCANEDQKYLKKKNQLIY